jgi:hypothetical protein
MTYSAPVSKAEDRPRPLAVAGYVFGYLSDTVVILLAIPVFMTFATSHDGTLLVLGLWVMALPFLLGLPAVLLAWDWITKRRLAISAAPHIVALGLHISAWVWFAAGARLLKG